MFFSLITPSAWWAEFSPMQAGVSSTNPHLNHASIYVMSIYAHAGVCLRLLRGTSFPHPLGAWFTGWAWDHTPKTQWQHRAFAGWGALKPSHGGTAAAGDAPQCLWKFVLKLESQNKGNNHVWWVYSWQKADTLQWVPPTQLSMSQQESEHILALLMTHMGVTLMQWDKSPLLSSLLFLPRQYQFNVNCNADCEPEHSEARSCQSHCLCILLCIPQRPFPIWCHRQRVHS